MPITVTKLAPACGAEISSVDLREPLDADTVAAIRKAWMENLIICFRGQDLTPDDQKRVCGYFGRIGPYNRPKERQNPKYASDTIMLVSNVKDEQGRHIGAHPDGEMMWHTDTAYTARPHMATTLFGVEIPETGGNTLFSNQYMVYDALPDALKQKLAGKSAVNAYEFGTTVKTFDHYDRARVPHHTHPVLRKHPETGRAAVYVCELMTEEIEGLMPEENAEVLAEIYALQRRPEFIYAHRWQVGDLVMWDNRCLLHARADFPREQRRLLRRVTIEDAYEMMAA
jgi:taurine dioxygenase